MDAPGEEEEDLESLWEQELEAAGADFTSAFAERAARARPPWPIDRWEQGAAVPRMIAIPEDRWLDVLRPLPWRVRDLAAGTIGRHQAQHWNVTYGLLLTEEPRPFRARPGATRVPSAPRPESRRRNRQVSFRLDNREYDELRAAARLFRTTPAALARMLTMRGAAAALEDEQAAREAAKGAAAPWADRLGATS